jgi:hypothetical protein
VEAVARGLAGLLAKIELELWKLAPQPRQQPGQEEGRDRRDHAHSKLARQRPAGSPDHVGQLLRFPQDPAGLGGDLGAERRESNHPFGPLDQNHPDQALKLPYPARKGRLGDEAGLGRPSEMPRFLEGDEILQLLQRGDVSAHRLIRSKKAN